MKLTQSCIEGVRHGQERLAHQMSCLLGRCFVRLRAAAVLAAGRMPHPVNPAAFEQWVDSQTVVPAAPAVNTEGQRRLAVQRQLTSPQTRIKSENLQ